MTTILTVLTVASTATTSGTLAAGKHTPVDASSGVKTMTLPTPADVGASLRVEKVDGSGSAVTVVGTIRGNAAGSISLASQYQAIEFWAESLTSWRPVSDRRSDSSIQDMIDSAVTTAVATALATGLQGTLIKLKWSATTGWPIRPDTSVTGQFVEWWGPGTSPVPLTGTTSGGTAAAAPDDDIFYT